MASKRRRTAGCEPRRPSENCSTAKPSNSEDNLAPRRWQRQIERIHECGPRAFAELLRELGAELLIRDAIERKVARYAELDPELVRAVGGDRFPPFPLHLVPACWRRVGL